MKKNITKLPNTLQGEKLKLTEKQEKELLLVYSKNENGFLEFKELYNPQISYSENDFIIPIRSVYGDIKVITENITFANIIGSKDDPKPKPFTQWIDLMYSALCAFLSDEDYVRGYLGNCITDGNFYHDNNLINHSKNCGGNIVGGHILFGDTPSTINSGSQVYLLPICHNHNMWYDRQGGKKYMKAQGSQDNHIYVVVLNNYLEFEKTEQKLDIK